LHSVLTSPELLGDPIEGFGALIPPAEGRVQVARVRVAVWEDGGLGLRNTHAQACARERVRKFSLDTDSVRQRLPNRMSGPGNLSIDGNTHLTVFFVFREKNMGTPSPPRLWNS